MRFALCAGGLVYALPMLLACALSGALVPSLIWAAVALVLIGVLFQ